MAKTNLELRHDQREKSETSDLLGTRSHLNVLLPGAHHALLAVWDSKLPDERALIFLGPTQQAAKQRIRADLIHQLFPRVILLTERHRRARFCQSLDFTSLFIEVMDSAAEHIAWTSDGDRARLVLSEDCWNRLLPTGFLRRFVTTVEHLFRIFGQNGNSVMGNWHQVVDAGRTLREEFANALLLFRRKIGDEATRRAVGKAQLLKAIESMANAEQLCDRRRREYCDQKRGFESLLHRDVVTLFVDSETVDDFLCLLQALRCYMGNNKCLHSWLRRVPSSQHQALSVVALGRRIPAENFHSPVNEQYLQTVYASYVEPAHEGNNGTDGTAVVEVESTLPDPIHAKVKTWINGTGLDLLCGCRLIELARCLAERHSVHEGRQLHYRFAYAPSTSLWQEIEDVLSFEAALPDSGRDMVRDVDQAVEEQAKFIEAHWSIFQPERVFGLVDTLMSEHTPRIQRVVRVRPPRKWSGLESEAMEGLSGAAAPCLVVVVLRQWVVRLSFSKDGTNIKPLEWDVREHKPKPEAHAKYLASRIAQAAGIDELRVSDMLTTVLSEVSEAAGEGALVVAVGNGNVREIVKQTCMEMDGPSKRMAWRNGKRLRWVDRTLLRAMLILDGATVIQPGAYGEPIIRPRLVVYPFVVCKKHPTSFSVISWKKPRQERGCTCPALDKLDVGVIKRVQSRLVGKGSRKHGAANIAVLLELARGRKLVVSVSADGPIEKWPPDPEDGVKAESADQIVSKPIGNS